MFKRFSFIPARTLLLLIQDVAIVLLAQLAMPYLLISPWSKYDFLINSRLVFLANPIIVVFSLYCFDLYNSKLSCVTKDYFSKLYFSISVSAVLSVLLCYLLRITFYNGRLLFFVFWLGIIIILYSVRLLGELSGFSCPKRMRALILGCGDRGRDILSVVRSSPSPEIEIIGFLDKAEEKKGKIVGGVPIYHQAGSLRDAVEQLRPDLLILAMRRSRYEMLTNDLVWCAMQGMEIWDVPAAFERLAGTIPLRYIDETWLLFAAMNSGMRFYRRLRRILDVTCAVVGLLLAMPVLLLAAACIRIDSSGPIILRQQRVGQGGKIISILKFRTMNQCKPLPGETGTCVNDIRVTRVGRIIRKLHVDEIPQLLNVIKGDLSLIGPRAELADFIYGYFGGPSAWLEPGFIPSTSFAQVTQPPSPKQLEGIIPYFEYRFTVPQGITGWAQIMAPLLTSSHDDMVEKLAYDLYYIKNMSLALDIIIIFKTARIVLLGRGK